MSNKAHTYAHLASFALTSPWAVERELLVIIADTLGRRIAGDEEMPDVEALAQRRDPLPAPKGIALIPAHGVIMPRANQFSKISGGTTFEQMTAALRDAVDNRDVGSIVIDWDSPGGNVQGAAEFAREMLRARTVKPVISQVHHKMCSAAYHVGSCATEVVCTPSGVVGAVGVYSIHEDLSNALQQRGIKRTYIAKGKYKVEGNEATPLSEDALARWSAELDAPYGRMVRDIALGRGVPETDVRAGFGEGRAVQAEDALALKMIDRIGTLDDTLTRLASPTAASPQQSVTASPAAAAALQSPSEDAEVEARRRADRAWRFEVERTFLQQALG